MNDRELQQYLANIIAVVRTDNVLSPKEERALADIKAELKVKKSDANKAEKLAYEPGFKPKVVGRYSEKIRNIEDMLYVAMSDATLDPSEKSLILDVAKDAGLQQPQVNVIIHEAKSRVRSMSAVCPSCGSEVPGGSKFCPECGTSFSEAVEVVGTILEFDYPPNYISIEFAESTAASFPEALEAANKAPDFQSCDRNKKKWYLASWPKDRLPDSLALAGALSGIKNRKVLVDGKVEPWNDVFGFLWCFRERERAYRPVEYCFGIDDKCLNLWGCKRVGMNWTGYNNDWLSYGKYTNQTVFGFDKKRIRHELESKLYDVRFCPALRLPLVDAIFELFPERVTISERSGWTYAESYQATPTSVKVTVRQATSYGEYASEFYSDRVKPVGFTVAIELLKEGLQRCRMPDVNLRLLMGSQA